MSAIPTADPTKPFLAKRSPSRKLALAGLLAASAYGSNRLGNWMVPDQTRAAVSDMEKAYQQLQTTRALSGENVMIDDSIKRYAQTASRLANSPVFGTTGANVIKFLRTSTPLARAWEPFHSDAHYGAFTRGGVYGAAQLLDEHAKVMAYRKDVPKDSREFFRKDFTPKFEEKVNDVARETAGRNLTESPSLRESLAFGKTTIDPAAQERVMQQVVSGPEMTGSGFWNSINPFNRKFTNNYGALKQDLSRHLLSSSFPAYLDAGRKAVAVGNVAKKWIPAALAVAALGAGAVGIRQHLKNKRRELERQAAMRNTPKPELTTAP